MPRSTRLATFALLGFAVLGALAACGSDSTAPVVVTGTYALSVAAANTLPPENCHGSGTLTILQSGTTLNGDVSGLNVICTGTVTTTISISGPLSNGHIDGNHITYSNSTCTWDGHATGDPATAIDGDVSCTVSIQNTNVTVNGTFSAIR